MFRCTALMIVCTCCLPLATAASTTVAEDWQTVELLTLASVLRDGVPFYADVAGLAADDPVVILPQNSLVTRLGTVQDDAGMVIAVRVSVPWNERFRIGLVDCNSIHRQEAVLVQRFCKPAGTATPTP